MSVHSSAAGTPTTSASFGPALVTPMTTARDLAGVGQERRGGSGLLADQRRAERQRARRRELGGQQPRRRRRRSPAPLRPIYAALVAARARGRDAVERGVAEQRDQGVGRPAMVAERADGRGDAGASPVAAVQVAARHVVDHVVTALVTSGRRTPGCVGGLVRRHQRARDRQAGVGEVAMPPARSAPRCGRSWCPRSSRRRRPPVMPAPKSAWLAVIVELEIANVVRARRGTRPPAPPVSVEHHGCGRPSSRSARSWPSTANARRRTARDGGPASASLSTSETRSSRMRVAASRSSPPPNGSVPSAGRRSDRHALDRRPRPPASDTRRTRVASPAGDASSWRATRAVDGEVLLDHQLAVEHDRARQPGLEDDDFTRRIGGRDLRSQRALAAVVGEGGDRAGEGGRGGEQKSGRQCRDHKCRPWQSHVRMVTALGNF